ncbi:hypothetical protein EYM_07835 [Ignicoccus islandicus DSM 13165]|uniref:Uncharacterized protein n=1 Tax=Ignicoccus islandicus DSM 13165 TaxID=940295 RepID=A0A0U3F9W8_9CREN|nr:hypothetical protein EYM_07835 [Ignicoccus islandicus DSM 13165]
MFTMSHFQSSITFPLFTLIIWSWSNDYLIHTSKSVVRNSIIISSTNDFLVLNVTSLVVALDGYTLYRIIATEPPVTVYKLANVFKLRDSTIIFFRIVENTTLMFDSTQLQYYNKPNSGLNVIIDMKNVIGFIVILVEIVRRAMALEYRG